MVRFAKMKTYCGGVIEKYSKTVGEKTEIDKIMTLALILQRIFGHQVLDPDWNSKKFFLHQFFTIILIIYVFFGTLDVVRTTNDTELIAEAGYTLILVVICPVKLFLFINNRFLFRKLYVTAKTALFTAVKDDSSDTIKEVLAKGSKVVYALLAMVVVPVSVYELTTIWNYMNGRRVRLSQSAATLMPMTSPYYEIAWFLHSVFLTEMSSIVIVIDMWFVFLMYFLCVANDVLVKILIVPPKQDYENQHEYSNRLKCVLRRFYLAHVQQTEYLNCLNRMYKWLAFVPLCNAALCICIVLLVMSKEINLRFAPHMLPLLAEIFSYSWFGEQVKSKAAAINEALLNFDWINLKRTDKKSYYILLSYMQKEFGVKTANGRDLSMITMTTVLKGSYQAFTVLQLTVGN